MGSGSFKHCGKTPVVIGSYSFRGKVHICRLLCEYLDIYYVNEFFDPYSWDIYKKKNANEWLFPELPFLKDGKFTITDTPAICEYLIKKSGKLQLLGRDIDDQTQVDIFLYGKSLIQAILSLIMQHKDKLNELDENVGQIWKKNLHPRFVEYEAKAKSNEYYLGYLSIIDFFLAETINIIGVLYSEQLQQFPKLLSIKKHFFTLPTIKQYQSSCRTVKNSCPLEFFKQWKKGIFFKK